VIQSILTSTKKVLNVEEEDVSFDEDILMHINSAFSTLNQLGVGPDEGFMIEDKVAIWNAFLEGDPRLNNVKSYIFLRVRMLFDPPTLGYVVTAMQKQIEELEWRLNVQREDVEWTEPVRLSIHSSVLDGGFP
jgi:hypothetical protein